MSLKRSLFLLLILLLPADGTDYLRIEIRGVGVSILDLLLVAVLYLDLIDGSLLGFRAPRFALRVCALALAAACLSAVSLLYVPPFRIGSDVKVTLNLLQLAVTAYLAARTFRTRRSIRTAVSVLVASVAVVAAATVGKSLGLDIPGDTRTAAVTFGGLTFGVSGLTQIPGPISLVLLAAFPAVALPALFRSAAMRAALASLLLLAAAVTFSRSLWLALAVEALVLLWLGALTPGREAPGRGRRRYAFRLALAAAAAALLWVGPRLFDLLVSLRPTTVSGRLAGFADAWQVATQTPGTFLFGAGKGTYRLWTGAGTVPHNAVLDLLVAKGALAVIVFLALQVWVMARLWRRLRPPDADTAVLARALLTGLAGLLAFGLFSPTMTSLVLWVTIGLATALVSIEETRPPSTPAPAAPRGWSRPSPGPPASGPGP